jgi:hypothetical protein
MSDRLSARGVLNLIKRYYLKDWQLSRLAVAKKRFATIQHVALTARRNEITPEMERDSQLALGWLADVHLNGHVPLGGVEIAKCLFDRIDKFGRDAAQLISEIADAAVQHPPMKPDAFHNAREMLLADLENNLGIEGDSPAEIHRKTRNVLSQWSIGGSPAHIAFHSNLKMFREHAQRDIAAHIIGLPAIQFLDELDRLARARIAGFLEHDELQQKWNGWCVLGAPTEQSQQCERDLFEAEEKAHDARDCEAALIAGMKRATEMMPSFGIDRSPLDRWIELETAPPAHEVTTDEVESVGNNVSASLKELKEKLEAQARSKAAELNFTLDVVTLDQAAGMVKRTKRALEEYKGKGLPDPDVSAGGGGKPRLWKWATIRPFLLQFRPDLPQTFPANG